MYKIPTLRTRKRADGKFVGTCSCKEWELIGDLASLIGTEWMTHVREDCKINVGK